MHQISADITPWLVGPSTYTLPSGNIFVHQLMVSNSIGSGVTEDVRVELMNFDCLQFFNLNNPSITVNFPSINPDPANFSYSVFVNQSNIADDDEDFVFMTGEATGDIKFCSRVSTMEGSIQVAFRETKPTLPSSTT